MKTKNNNNKNIKKNTIMNMMNIKKKNNKIMMKMI